MGFTSVSRGSCFGLMIQRVSWVQVLECMNLFTSRRQSFSKGGFVIVLSRLMETIQERFPFAHCPCFSSADSKVDFSETLRCPIPVCSICSILRLLSTRLVILLYLHSIDVLNKQLEAVLVHIRQQPEPAVAAAESGPFPSPSHLVQRLRARLRQNLLRLP